MYDTLIVTIACDWWYGVLLTSGVITGIALFLASCVIGIACAYWHRIVLLTIRDGLPTLTIKHSKDGTNESSPWLGSAHSHRATHNSVVWIC